MGPPASQQMPPAMQGSMQWLPRSPVRCAGLGRPGLRARAPPAQRAARSQPVAPWSASSARRAIFRPPVAPLRAAPVQLGAGRRRGPPPAHPVTRATLAAVGPWATLTACWAACARWAPTQQPPISACPAVQAPTQQRWGCPPACPAQRVQSPLARARPHAARARAGASPLALLSQSARPAQQGRLRR